MTNQYEGDPLADTTQPSVPISFGIGNVGLSTAGRTQTPTTDSGTQKPPVVDWNDIDSLRAYEKWLQGQMGSVDISYSRGRAVYDNLVSEAKSVSASISKLETIQNKASGGSQSSGTGVGRQPSEAEIVINHLAQRIKAGNLSPDQANTMFEDYLGMNKAAETKQAQAVTMRGQNLSAATSLANTAQQAWQASIPYTLPRGTQQPPGFEAGGPMQKLTEMSGATYNPQNYRVAQIEQDAWKQSIAPLLQQFGGGQ